MFKRINVFFDTNVLLVQIGLVIIFIYINNQNEKLKNESSEKWSLVQKYFISRFRRIFLPAIAMFLVVP